MQLGSVMSAVSPDGSLLAMEIVSNVVVFDATFGAVEQVAVNPRPLPPPQ